MTIFRFEADRRSSIVAAVNREREPGAILDAGLAGALESTGDRVALSQVRPKPDIVREAARR